MCGILLDEYNNTRDFQYIYESLAASSMALLVAETDPRCHDKVINKEWW